MIIGRVIGTIVCTQKDDSLQGKKMLIVQPLNIYTMTNEGGPAVALDAVGAGEGEIVMMVSGSSARLASGYSKIAVDQSVIAILDTIDVEGKTLFKKSD